MTRVRTLSQPCTRADLERAIALRAHDLPWSVIADRLGRDRGALEVAVCRYRRGRWHGRRERMIARLQAAERFITETGTVEVALISDALGLSRGAVSSALLRNGLDREMREELAALNRRAA